MSDRATVLLADDHALVADGIAALLQTEFELVGRAVNGRELVDVARALEPHVIVTDISMPVLNGIDALRELGRLLPGTPVVVVTMYADPHLAAEAVRVGARGYVLKHSAGTELIRAVHEVHAGRVYVTPLIARELDDPAGRVRLTARQREVLQLVARGHTMKQVAAALRVSRRTAETHKYQMMEQLGVHSTAELVKYAIRLGLVAVDGEPSSP